MRLGFDVPDMSMHRSSGVIAATVLGVIAVLIFIIQPGYVQALVDQGGLGNEAAGCVASAEMAGIALVTLVMSWAAHRFSWRPMLAIAVFLEVAGNIACLFFPDLLGLSVARFIAGLGAGTLASLSFAAISQTSDPDRYFGFLIMWILIYGAIGLWALPVLLAVGGLHGFYILIAGLALMGFLFIKHMPNRSVAAVSHARGRVASPASRMLAIASIFVFFLGCGVLWAYLALIGVNEGVSDASVAAGLGASQVAGIGGALIVGIFGSRIGRFAPLVLGILICAASTALLIEVGPGRTALFMIAVCAFNFAWNAVQPIYLSAATHFDSRGRLITQMVASQMLGLAVGPFLGGVIVGQGTLQPVIWWSAAFLAISALLITPSFLEAHSIGRV